jgi:5'-3' exonuclease
MIRGIQEALQTKDYKAFLSASGPHYRHEIYPAYKANRKAEKPTHYHRLRDYLLETHGAELVLDQEADDALGIEQTHQMNDYDGHPVEGGTTGYAGYPCIVTIDKDLDQIPGWHYNFVKKEKYWVTPDYGLRYFYEQILQGDRIDNIPGLYGIGPVKARALLAACKTEREMYDVVLREYERAPIARSGATSEAAVLLRGRLLKIRTKEGELWQPPK